MKSMLQKLTSGALLVASVAMPQLASASHRNDFDFDRDIDRRARLRLDNRTFDSRFINFHDRDDFFRRGFLLWCHEVNSGGADLLLCRRV